MTNNAKIKHEAVAIHETKFVCSPTTVLRVDMEIFCLFSGEFLFKSR